MLKFTLYEDTRGQSRWRLADAGNRTVTTIDEGGRATTRIT